MVNQHPTLYQSRGSLYETFLPKVPWKFWSVKHVVDWSWMWVLGFFMFCCCCYSFIFYHLPHIYKRKIDSRFLNPMKHFTAHVLLPTSSSFMFLCYRHDLLKTWFWSFGRASPHSLHHFFRTWFALLFLEGGKKREKNLLAVENIIHLTTYCTAYNLGRCKAKGLKFKSTLYFLMKEGGGLGVNTHRASQSRESLSICWLRSHYKVFQTQVTAF